MSGYPNRSGWLTGDSQACDLLSSDGQRAYRLVLLGPPGVGKGTQAQLLAQALHACHLSTGDLIRAARCEARPSPAMRAALAAMKRGELVSDEIVVSMVRERAECLRCQGGFLLDGFPRTVAQAESLAQLLDELGVHLDAVVSYELPIDEIVDRLGGRRTCPSCRAVYHVSARPPKTPGRCDACEAALIVRDDDQPEAIRVRMRQYDRATAPLAEYYDRRGLLLTIPAWGEPQQICDRTLSALAEMTAVGASAGEFLPWPSPRAASPRPFRRTTA